MLPERFDIDALMRAYIDWQRDGWRQERHTETWYADRFAAIEACFGVQPSLYQALLITNADEEACEDQVTLDDHLITWLDEEPKRKAVAEIALRDALRTCDDEKYREEFYRQLDRTPRLEAWTIARYLKAPIAVIGKIITLCQAKQLNPFLADKHGSEARSSPFLHQARRDHEARWTRQSEERIKQAIETMRPLLMMLYPGCANTVVSPDDLYQKGHPKGRPEPDLDYYD